MPRRGPITRDPCKCHHSGDSQNNGFGGTYYTAYGTVDSTSTDVAVTAQPVSTAQPDFSSVLPGIASILGTVEGVQRVQQAQNQQPVVTAPLIAPTSPFGSINPMMLLLLGGLALLAMSGDSGPHRRH